MKHYIEVEETVKKHKELASMTEPERHASLAEVRGYRTEALEAPNG